MALSLLEIEYLREVIKEVRVKLEALEETRSFYKAELKKAGLTEMERNSYLSALKAIDQHIKGKQNFDKSNKFNEKGR
ncbi:hypothetical protein ES705_34221 [subsurface metagenome]